MRVANILATALAILAAGCVSTAFDPVIENHWISEDTVNITVSAAPVCGFSAAKEGVFRAASIQTINKGYDGFIILQQDGSHGGIGPAYMALRIKMIHGADPLPGDAVSARATLGPRWQTIVHEGIKLTCLE